MKLTIKMMVMSVFMVGVYSLAEGTDSSITGDAAALQGDTVYDPNSSMSSSNPAASASSGNSISQGIVGNTVQSADQVKEDPNSNSSGREYKAGDARNQGNTGAAMAAATGASLAGSAIPLLMSPFPAERAAGADLMAKAGLEFAQAGADSSSAKQNNSQNQMLRQNADQTVTAPTGGGETGGSPSYSNPALDGFLASKGIDPAQFNQALTSGSFKSGSDVMAVLGMASDVSADDLAKANDISAQVLGNAFAEAEKNHPKEFATLKYDEGNSGATGKSADGAGRVHDAVGMAGDSSSASGEFGAGGVASVNGQTALPNQNGKGDAKYDADGNLIDGSLDKLKSLLGLGATANSAKKWARLSEKELRKMGIVGRGRGTIFQIAGTSYRSFGRWRMPKHRLAVK